MSLNKPAHLSGPLCRIRGWTRVDHGYSPFRVCTLGVWVGRGTLALNSMNQRYVPVLALTKFLQDSGNFAFYLPHATTRQEQEAWRTVKPPH